MFSRLKSKNIIRICFLFLAVFFVGTGAAFLHDHFFSAAVPTSSEGNWGLSFQTDGDPPVGNATFDELKKFDAFYAQDTGEKVIYLTFDAGYENGNTPAILEALTKHQAPATFFVVGTLLESNPELIKQILAAGNTIGNHTWHHKDMSQISTMESFSEEIQTVEKLYQQITRQEISRFYRPPQGKYSEANLKMAQDLGYHTFFWSLAYVDWYQDSQPSHEEAFEKLLGRIHPGAIVLLHSTSSTNAEILDELLTKWEEMGYHFASLDDLIKATASLEFFSVTLSEDSLIDQSIFLHRISNSIFFNGLCNKFCIRFQHLVMRAHRNRMPGMPEHGQIIAAVSKYI